MHQKKILLDVFNTKVRKEDVFKPTIWNESLHQITNDTEARVVSFATSEHLVDGSSMFLHHEIHKHIWTYPSRNYVVILVTSL
jgi:hypothetical protein